MKLISRRKAWIGACLVALSVSAEPGKVREACVGDSITSGHLLDNPGRDAYPARLQRPLGEGVRGWLSMERPAPTARDAVVDRLDFVRLGVPLAEGAGVEDVKFDFRLLRGDESKLVADWKVADGFLLVDLTDSAKDGTRYLLDAEKSTVSFVAAARGSGHAGRVPLPAAGSSKPPCNWPDDDWAGRPRHLAVVNPPVPVEEGSVLSLRGEWDFLFRKNDDAARIHAFHKLGRWPGERKINVPGCWESQGVGEPSDMVISYGHPVESRMPLRNFANGSGWYRRHVTVPSAWKDKRIWLKTGGVRGRGRFWVNDVPVARLDDYIGTWKYDITDLIRHDRPNKIVAEVSNYHPTRNTQLDSYSRWGGIWRDVELEATPRDVWIDDAYVRGDFATMRADVRVTLGGDTNAARIVTTVPDGLKPWSPESPNLYTAKVELVARDGRVLQTRFERFGIRSFEARGNTFFLNGKPFFARAFGDDSIYPLTGLTPPDRDFHRRHLMTARAAGFNYVRTHTHTEIDEYFQAADEAGVLVQPELSYNMDESMGFFSYNGCGDALQMHLQLRRHPSFATYSFGNEGCLGEAADRRLYRFVKALDPDRLVINQDGGRDNTFGTADLKSGPMAIWERGAYEPGMPFIAHEYLNLTVKSDPRLEKDYTGVYGPTATMSARTKWLEERGLGPEWVERLQDAQHALQAFWQKYGIEQARLDPFCDGFCFWTLVDVVGAPQDGVTCSANGYLDSFWRPKKGGWSLEEFARFNSSVGVFVDTAAESADAPLALSWNRGQFDWPDDECYRYADRERFVYEAGEEIPLAFHFDNYGEGAVRDAELVWSIDGKTERKKLDDLCLGGIRCVHRTAFKVPEVRKAERFRLDFSVVGTVEGMPFKAGNSRDFWFFPRRASRRVAGVAAAKALKGALDGRYKGLEELGGDGVKIAIVEAGSPEEMAALRSGVHVVSISNQTGVPNNRLGWWFAANQVGMAFKRHPMLARLPFEPFLSPLLFRIVKDPARLPIESLEQGEVIVAGEGKDFVGLYLSDGRTSAGGRHVRVTGLDVLSDTPEGTALLDGILDYLVCR